MTPFQQAIAAVLFRAGYSVGEIAQILSLKEATVQDALSEAQEMQS